MRRPRWAAAAAVVAATAIATVATILVLDAVRPGPDRAASSGVVGPPSTGEPAVSADRKSVVVGQAVVLTVDNDQIVEWFRTQSQLCDSRNLGTRPDRRMFCADKVTFKDKSRFAAVVSSPDGTKVGFTIATDTLAPDTVAGIFVRSTGAISILTTYYIGSEFISFSPSGVNFVYQGSCFEAKCALYIRGSATLAERARLNDVTGTERTQNATFVRWISDNEVEYRLGAELKRASF